VVSPFSVSLVPPNAPLIFILYAHRESITPAALLGSAPAFLPRVIPSNYGLPVAFHPPVLGVSFAFGFLGAYFCIASRSFLLKLESGHAFLDYLQCKRSVGEG
jgi:hypothetical protein